MRSMTGFGRGQVNFRYGTVEVELRAVNQRFFKFKSTIPDVVHGLEKDAENVIRESLSRGSVHMTVSLTLKEEGARPVLDRELVEEYLKDLRKVQRAQKLPGEIEIRDILQLPQIWKSQGPVSVEQEQLWTPLKKAIKQAVVGLVAMRDREGKTIEKDVRGRLKEMSNELSSIKKKVPTVVSSYQDRLQKRTSKLLNRTSDDGRIRSDDLAREIAVYSDRCDISEELQRFQAHIKEFRVIVKAAGEMGRKLEFLTQEMFREANTMSAKANDAEISSYVVRIKATLEKMREQLENVE